MGLDAAIKMFQKGTTSKEIEKTGQKRQLLFIGVIFTTLIPLGSVTKD